MRQTLKPNLMPAVHFTPEDKERMADRLGLLHDCGFDVLPGVGQNQGTASTRQTRERHAEVRARQEIEHVLRFEYLGL